MKTIPEDISFGSRIDGPQPFGSKPAVKGCLCMHKNVSVSTEFNRVVFFLCVCLIDCELIYMIFFFHVDYVGTLLLPLPFSLKTRTKSKTFESQQ